MNRTRRHASSLVLLTLACTLATSACNDLPRRRGATVVGEATRSASLEARNPIEIVVAPVVDESKGRIAPAAELRRAFHDGLVKRRYSPLALPYVDQALRGNEYQAGLLGEDAVLTLWVESWDTTYWSTNDTVGVRAEARLTDSKSNEVLWSGRIDHPFRLDNARARFSTERLLVVEVCRAIAEEFLAALPARAAGT